MIPLVYIAGPFTAPTPWGIEANIRAAEEAAAAVIEREDCAALVPHSLGRHFVGRAGSADYWYRATMEMLRRCDAVVLVAGWEGSKGTRAEVRAASEREVPVYLSAEDWHALTPADPCLLLEMAGEP